MFNRSLATKLAVAQAIQATLTEEILPPLMEVLELALPASKYLSILVMVYTLSNGSGTEVHSSLVITSAVLITTFKEDQLVPDNLLFSMVEIIPIQVNPNANSSIPTSPMFVLTNHATLEFSLPEKDQDLLMVLEIPPQLPKHQPLLQLKHQPPLLLKLQQLLLLKLQPPLLLMHQPLLEHKLNKLLPQLELNKLNKLLPTVDNNLAKLASTQSHFQHKLLPTMEDAPIKHVAMLCLDPTTKLASVI